MDASSICSGSGCKKIELLEHVDTSDDRISKLHDTVLRHILSFLPTKDAVQTCILSKRFDNMWTSVRNLSFDNPSDVKRDLFLNFVERVLTHRDFSSLHKVFFDLAVRGDAMRITTWISAVMKRKVRALDISLSDIKTSLVFPHCLFKSNSLEELDISMSHVLRLPPTVCLSSLRVLYLQAVIFPSYYLTQQFFSGCPVLEELDIIVCYWQNLRAFSISCPKLKRLTISELAKDEGGGDNLCRVSILSTCLEFFHCRGEFRNDYILSETSSIVETWLYIWANGEPERTPEVSYRLHKLMKVLPNITKLELSDSAVEMFGYANELFMGVPIYKNLTHLEFGTGEVGLHLDGLHKILLRSPHLECIYFCDGVRLNFGIPVITEQIFTPVPSCFMSHLQVIEVGGFTGSEDEVTAVKIMLAKAAVLEKMVISCIQPLEGEVCERLMLLPRSSGCSLVLRLLRKNSQWQTLSAMDASSICSGSGCKKIELLEHVDASDDRISKLHDTVLRHILSFLPTKDAVQTCILSKRFDNMWTSVRNLSFDNPSDVKRDLFLNFVERVLTHRDFSSLHKVFFDLAVRGDAMRITTWISAVMKRKVRALDISLSDIKTSLVFPHCLFKSNSLEELDISMSHVLRLPPTVCLSSLRVLYLQAVIFPSDYLTQQFFSGCPVLEELDINVCYWQNLRAFSISCPKLKRLTISELAKDEGGGDNLCRVSILSTGLEFFHCRGEFRNDYILSETSSIVETWLYIWANGEPERIPEVSNRLHKLMKVLPNITRLELSDSAVEMFGYANELFMGVPIYKNLTHLEFGMGEVGFHLEGLHKILLRSPHLECIYFAHGILPNFGIPVITEDTFTPVPSCFTSHLQVIEVGGFIGSEDEVTAVKIMLAKAAVLEKMVISCKIPMEEEVRERLMLLPRSPGCSLVLL